MEEIDMQVKKKAYFMRNAFGSLALKESKKKENKFRLEAIKEKELPDGVNIQKMKFWSCVVQYLTLLS